GIRAHRHHLERGLAARAGLLRVRQRGFASVHRQHGGDPPAHLVVARRHARDPGLVHPRSRPEGSAVHRRRHRRASGEGAVRRHPHAHHPHRPGADEAAEERPALAGARPRARPDGGTGPAAEPSRRIAMAAATELRFSVAETSGEVSALLVRPPDARLLYVLAHGAGAGMRHTFLESIAQRLAECGIATLRYQFPYMEPRAGRPDPPAVAAATGRAAVTEAARAAPGPPPAAAG